MQVCIRGFAVQYGGDHVAIARGELLADDHELVARYPDAFEDETTHERRAALSRGLARGDFQMEAGAAFHTTTTRKNGDDVRSAALRAVERHQATLTPEAVDRLERAIRSDRAGADSAYLAAVAEPAYNTAFGKILQHGSMAPMRFTPEEQEAVQAVNRAEEMRVALAVGTGATGGFAVPFALDPTIINTSAGVNNPIREIARSVEITGATEWRGVSSAGVTSNYGAEGSEVNDDAPTLAQPTIKAHRWTSFVPFSIEVGQDWGSLQAELGELMRDAKDTLDATMFLTGTGADQPGGILNIGGPGGLTVTQRVQTAAIATFAVGDVYKLKQALPPRFQAGGTYVVAPAILDVVYRMVAAGSTSEAALLNAERTAIIGRSVRELSTMTTTTTTGSRIAIYADWRSAFAVVDRLGVQVELVNHLFGVNRRPTGQRGVLAIGRTGSGVVNANAARYLEVL